MNKSLIRASVMGTAASLIGVGVLTWGVPVHAGTQTIVGQGAYLCQSAPKDLPTKTYNVTIRMSLSAPTAVAPGQSVSLSGTMTMQFPQEAYQEGKTYGVTEAEGYSNTLSVATTANGRTTDVSANRWQTAPFPWRDPVVISAPITFKPFTVPSSASESLTITLPRNERRAPNLASNNPSTVAFNAVATNRTAAGDISENLGCYLQGTAPSVIARIPISSAAGTGTAAVKPGAAGAATASAPSATTTQPRAAGTTAPAKPGDRAATGAGATTATTRIPAVGGQTATDQVASGPYASERTGSGVFVSTNLLILGGGLICILAVGYALLTNYRIRNIRRALDG